jgi:WD40 repeat protein/energy-coupling factor transporter ATP-binding protein EcfA2
VNAPALDPLDLFVLHSTDPDDDGFVNSYLVPALNLPPERVRTSSEPDLGRLCTEVLTERIVGSSVTVAVLSPSFFAQSWSSFGNSLATHHAIHGGQLVPLLRTELNVPLISKNFVTLDFCKAERQADEIARLRKMLDQPEPRRRDLPCPYPGMHPYTEERAHAFGGREEEVDALVARIAGGLKEIYLVGASGSGKSSLLRAGVAARLQRTGDSVVKEPFDICVVRPGSEVAKGLAGARSALAATAARVLVIVDPLEEVLLEGDVEARRAFFEEINELRADSRCHLAFALRSDFHGELIGSALWGRAKHAYRHTVAPLHRKALRRAIVTPASDVGVALAPTLVEWLLGDALDSPGALPLLQQALMHLWDRRKYDYLSVESYAEVGRGTANGLAAVLVAHADVVLGGLDEQERSVALRVLLRLVRINGATMTRRERRRGELHGEESPELLERVLSQLIRQRLISADGSEEATEPKLELIHEVLITAWPSLRRWLADHGSHESQRSVLDARARRWHQQVANDVPAGGLLDERELHELDGWLTAAVSAVIGTGDSLASFIAASRAARAAEVADREAREAELRRRLARYYVAQGRSHLRGGRGARAMPYLVAARELGVEGVALGSLVHWARRALPLYTTTSSALAMAWSPDGVRLALAESGGIRMWTPHLDQSSSWHGSPPAATQLAWSPNGRLLAVGRASSLQLWDPLSSERARDMPEHPATVTALAWSPDGTWLAISGGDTGVRLWDLRDSARPPVLLDGDGLVAALAWSPDGGHLATAGANQVRIWELACRQITGSLDAARVRSVAWSHDGALLATAADTLTMWNAGTGERLSMKDKHRHRVNALAWSPSATALAIASDDRTARLWNALTEKNASPLLEHAQDITAVAWSPDGARLATLASGVFVWDARDPAIQARTHATIACQDRSAETPAETASPDALRVVITSGKRAQVHEAGSRRAISMEMEHQAQISSVVWSHDGELLATASADRVVRVWDPRVGDVVTPDLQARAEVVSLSWSADDRQLIATLRDGSPQSWLIPCDVGSREDWSAAQQASRYRLLQGDLVGG